MKLWAFFLASTLLWLVLRFVASHRIRKTLIAGNPEEKMRAIGQWPVIGLLGWSALLSAISSGALLLAGWWLNRQTGASLADFEALLQRLTGARAWIANLSLGWFIFIGLVALAGMSKLLCERSKGKLRSAFDQRVERELANLSEKAERGEIENLPQTPEMLRVAEMIDGVDAAMKEMRSRGAQQEEAQFQEHREKLIAAYRSMDIRRRLNLDLDERELPLRKPESTLDKISFALFSEGVASQASGGTLALIAILSMLLLPAWVGIQRGGLIKPLETRIAQVQAQAVNERLRLEELALTANRESAQMALEAAIQKAPEEPKEERKDDDEETTINNLASYTEFRYFAARGIRPLNVSAAAIARAHAVSSRDRILAAHASKASGTVEHISASDGTTAIEREFIHAAETADRPPKPTSSYGKRVAENLQRAAKRNSSFLQTFKASYQRAATAESIGRIITSQLGASLIEPMVASPSEKWGLGLAAEADTVSRAFVEGEPLDQAISKSVGEETSKRYFSAADEATYRERSSRVISDVMQADMANYAEAHPPSLRVHERIDPSFSKAADDLLARNARFVGVRGDPTELILARQTYDSVFPVRAGGEADTAFGKAANLVNRENGLSTPNRESFYGGSEHPSSGGPAGGGGGGGGGGKAPAGRTASVTSSSRPRMASSGSPVKFSSSTSFSRGRSFIKLRGFAKVGGVLIGRDPKSRSTLTVTGLNWENASGGRITLRVTFADGTILTSVPHDDDLVYRAIIYAADQRPTAVTMVTASPLLELKILLHPALLDSRVGEEISELDRFVDTYAGGQFTPRLAASHEVEAVQALYHLAWAKRVATVVRLVKSEGPMEPDTRTAIDGYQAAAEGILGGDSNRTLVASLAIPLLTLPDEALSARCPLIKKTEFYDKDLVDRMRSAAKEAQGELSTFLDQIQASTKVAVSGSDPLAVLRGLGGRLPPPGLGARLNEEVIRKALRPPPSFKIWSGVRERDYELTPAALVMTTPDAAPNLNFMLQVAFTTAPMFLANGEPDQDYSDEQPWEFEGIKSALEETVLAEVQKNPNSREILRRSMEFVFLQRFFRNAFENRLGLEFPFGQVEKLASILRDRQPPALHTPRWNSRRGGLESTLSAVIEQGLRPIEPKLPDALTEWLKSARPSIEEGNTLVRTGNREALELLAAADPDTRAKPEWRSRWDAHWTKVEQQRSIWESGWDARLADLVELRNALEQTHLEDWTRAGGGRLLVALHEFSTGIAVRRKLGVHEDDKLMLEKRSATEARAELLELSSNATLRKRE